MSNSNPPPLAGDAGGDTSVPEDLEAQLKALLAGITGEEKRDGDAFKGDGTDDGEKKDEPEEPTEPEPTEEVIEGSKDIRIKESVDGTTDVDQLLLEQTLAEVQKALAGSEGISHSGQWETQENGSGEASQDQSFSKIQESDEPKEFYGPQESQVPHELLAEPRPSEKPDSSEESHETQETADQSSLTDLIQNALSALGGEDHTEVASNVDESKEEERSEEPTQTQGSEQISTSVSEQVQEQIQETTQDHDQEPDQEDRGELANAIANALAGIGGLSEEEPTSEGNISARLQPSEEDSTAAAAAALAAALGETAESSNDDSEVQRIQQQLQHILANDASGGAMLSESSSTIEGHEASMIGSKENDESTLDTAATAAAVEALAQALQQESSSAESGQIMSNEDAELSAQRALIEELSAAIRDDSTVVTKSNDQGGSTIPSIEDIDVRAMAELLSNSDLESTLTSLLSSSSGDSSLQSTEQTSKSNLSIAETLALSRSNIQKSREMLANRIDPMLNRKGYLHSWSMRKQKQQTVTTDTLQSDSQVSTQSESSQPRLPPSADTLLHLTAPQHTDALPPTESSTEPGNDSMLTALLLAKQMIGDEDDNSEGQDLELNAEAMEAIQQALQTLGKSLQEEAESDSQAAASADNNNLTSDSTAVNTPGFTTPVGTLKPGRKAKSWRYRSNGVLTPEDKERIRLENRERKQRWRHNNNIRNKDNDLRARLHRRAANIFGPEDSAKKQAWFEKEFHKRREQRMLREMQLDPSLQADNNDNSNGFVNTTSASASSSSADSLRAALEILGKTEGLNEGLAQTVDSLVKDPQLLKTLMGDLFGNEENNDNNLTNGSTSSSSNYTFQPQANIVKPIVGGGVMSTFRIRKPGTQVKPVPAKVPVPSSQPQFPSKYPDRGLTLLVRRAMKPRKKGGMASPTPPSAVANTITTPRVLSVNNSDNGSSGREDLQLNIDLISTGTDSEMLKRKRSLESISVTVSPRPPQYFASPSLSSKRFRSDTLAAATTKKVDDRRIKAFGFPPLLSAMSGNEKR